MNRPAKSSRSGSEPAKKQPPGAWSRFVRFVALMLVLFVVAGGVGLYRWVHGPLSVLRSPIELRIDAGDTPRDVAQRVVDAGVQTSPWLLYQWFRWSGDARRMRAGSYEFEGELTPRELLRKIVAGNEILARFRLVEGWTMRQVRAELARRSDLQQDSAAMDETALMAALGFPGVAAEGRFFPDTYAYAKGSSDLHLLQRAMSAMQRRLEAAWAQRNPDLPLSDPDQVLTLASIVEKETGRAADRAQIAGVFVNRLRIGMPLQTDPTVIYGLGEAFDGNLRRIDLLTDTPYNTYTRAGLPPTPIAMPGAAALFAVTQPAATKALYFVARGDGSSEFSDTLAEHNRAVDRYQRRPNR